MHNRYRNRTKMPSIDTKGDFPGDSVGKPLEDRRQIDAAFKRNETVVKSNRRTSDKQGRTTAYEKDIVSPVRRIADDDF